MAVRMGVIALLGLVCGVCGIEGAAWGTGAVGGPVVRLTGARWGASGCLAGSGSLAGRLRLQGVGSSPSLRLKGGASVQPAANFEEVGKAFVQHYYNIFDNDRAGLQNLYQDMSMMTFEGEQFQGAQAITQKLVGLSFQSVKHEVITADSHPTGGGGVLVFVCGNLKVDGGENPMKFSQVFCLMPLQGGAGFFCYNDIFRLNYG